MAEASNQSQPQDLLTVLLERNLISPAQAQLVQTDMEVTGMLAQDVLLARRWVKAETLAEVAPWRQAELQSRPTSENDPDFIQKPKSQERTNTPGWLD